MKRWPVSHLIHTLWPLLAIYGVYQLDPGHFDARFEPQEVFRSYLFRSYLHPVLACLFFVAFGFLGHFVAVNRSGFRSDFSDPQRNALIFLLGAFVCGFWVGFQIFPMSLVRYSVIVVFPLLALVALFSSRAPRVSFGLVGVILVFGLVNQNGALLEPLPDPRSRSGHLLERSREFLADLDGNIQLVRYLEENHFDDVIVAKDPFIQMLTLPEMGYVKKPLPHVIGAGRFPLVSAAIPFEDIASRGGELTSLCIYSANILERGWLPTLRPRKDEKIIYQDGSIGHPNQVFVRVWKFPG